MGESQGNSKFCKSRVCAASTVPGDLGDSAWESQFQGLPWNQAQDNEGLPLRGLVTMAASSVRPQTK